MTSRIAFIIAPLLAGLFVAHAVVLSAQGLRVTQPAPDCRLTRRAFDNPFSDTKGYVQPRIAWHAEYAIGSLALGYVAHRVLHLPPWASGLVTTLAIGVVPHVRSVLIQRRYPINPGDLAFDAWDRSTPAFWAAGHRDDSTRTVWTNHLEATGAWLVGYTALACFASP